jgi:mono/diheme cytochrome c family protein
MRGYDAGLRNLKLVFGHFGRFSIDGQFRYLTLFLALSLGSQAYSQSLEIVTPKGKTSFTLEQLQSKLKTITVKVDDPTYGTTKEFDAFSLNEVLQLGGASVSDKADELVFTALDGYSPNTPFAKLKSHRAFLAFQEHGTKGGFGLVAQGKTKVSAAPFYVVWEEGKKLHHEVPWPYQLAKIEVVDWAQKFPKVVPPQVAEDSAAMKGFAIFKAECIRCHSINLQGGDLGPELNAPQSVTEYWKPDVLKAFIQNTGTFRYKSKMPSFTHLKPDQINHVITYLAHMKKHKVKSPN